MIALPRFDRVPMGAAVIAEFVRDPTRGTPKVLHLEYGGMDGHIRGRQRERLHYSRRIKRIGPMHQVGLRVSARERHHTTRLQVRHHIVWYGGEGIDQTQTTGLSAPASQRHIQRLAGVIDVRPPVWSGAEQAWLRWRGHIEHVQGVQHGGDEQVRPPHGEGPQCSLRGHKTALQP